MRSDSLRAVFVEFMPEPLEEGVLYVSTRFKVAIHHCACGCGYNTVTPFGHPSGWNITINGDAVTLHPSIGNQNFPCRSHYWIRDSKVVWC